MSRRTYSRNAWESQLNGAINNSATTIAVDSATGLTAPVYLTISPDDPAKREVILVGSISTNDLNVTRGLAGSTSGAQAQNDGAVIRAVPVHQTLDDLFDDIEDLETHVGSTATADHPEASTSTRGFMSATDKTKLDTLDAAKQVTSGDLHDHNGGDGAQIAHSSLSGIAPASSNHVTGGDLHNHQGGDGGQINHSALAGLGNDEHPHYFYTDGTKQFAGDFDPDGNLTRSMGGASNAWASLFLGTLYDSDGNAAIDLLAGSRSLEGGDWDIDGSLLPATDLTHDLGDATNSWRLLFVRDIYDESGNLRYDTSLGQFHVNIDPGSVSTHSIGDSTNRWLTADIDTLYVDRGSASAPALTTRQDINTGIYFFLESLSGVGLAVEGSVKVAAYQSYTDVTNDLRVGGNVLRLPVKATAGDPAGGVAGDLYVNESSNTLRLYADAAWRTVFSW